jgi:hypothetical protein
MYRYILSLSLHQITFLFFFYFFSRNGVAAEPSVAQTCVMAQTTRTIIVQLVPFKVTASASFCENRPEVEIGRERRIVVAVNSCEEETRKTDARL